MTDDSKPQGTVQIALRISPDLRERVKAAADANNRSVNSELTATLEGKYPPPIDQRLVDSLKTSLDVLLIQMGSEEDAKLAREVKARLDQLKGPERAKFAMDASDALISKWSSMLDAMEASGKDVSMYLNKMNRAHPTPTDD